MKRVKKLYLENEDIIIPRTTLYRQTKRETSASCCIRRAPVGRTSAEHTESVCHINVLDFHLDSHTMKPHHEGNSLDVETSFNDSDMKDTSISSSDFEWTECETLSLNSDLSDLTDSDKGLEDDSNSSDESFESVNSASCNEDFNSDQQKQLKLLQCFMKHNLPASACRDILNFIPGELSYDKLLKQCGIGDFFEIHYCEICSAVFPTENEETYTCSTENCSGLRYKGDLHSQRTLPRSARKTFILANSQKQLRNLLMSKGK